ncbi:hypothetical protein OAW67_00505 [Planktomarina sp.]|jgi:hypothetical protein|nr:hypothetical protein [Planktomarina sp.]|tara:strand:- start:80 stop:313 length:234 start_codon:yes stop_codon:yes gene_type:complete
MTFENPQNGYRETVSRFAWVWALLFGFLYFAFKGVWRHALIGLLLGLVTAGFSWLIYPFFARSIVANHYRRQGWVEV